MNISEKINETINLIKEKEPLNGFAFAFSGGRDSTLIMKLLELTSVKFTPYYFVFSTENNDLLAFLKQFPDLIYIRHEKTFYDLCKEQQRLPLGCDRFCKKACKMNFSILYEKQNIIITGYKDHDIMHNWVKSYWYIKPETKNIIFSPIYNWTEDEIDEAISTLNINLYKDYYSNGRAYSCPFGSCLSKATKEKNYKKYPECINKLKDLAIYCYQHNKEIQKQFDSPEKYLEFYLAYDSKGEWQRLKNLSKDTQMPKAYISKGRIELK